MPAGHMFSLARRPCGAEQRADIPRSPRPSECARIHCVHSPPQPRSRRAAKFTRCSSGGRGNPLRLMRGPPSQTHDSCRVSRQCRRPAAGDTTPPPSASAARLVLLTPSPNPGVGQAAGAQRPSGSAGSTKPLPEHPALPALSWQRRSCTTRGAVSRALRKSIARRHRRLGGGRDTPPRHMRASEGSPDRQPSKDY
jgi:hypothetical protein